MVQSAQVEAQGYTSKSAYSPFHELLSHLGKQHDREVQLLSHALDMARQEVDKLRAALIAQLGPNCADVQGLSAAVLGSNSLLALLSAPGCSISLKSQMRGQDEETKLLHLCKPTHQGLIPASRRGSSNSSKLERQLAHHCLMG